MFLSHGLDNVHLAAGGATSARRTLAGEGICTLQRDVEIVNRIESEILSVTDFYSEGAPLVSTTYVATSRDLILRCWGARRNNAECLICRDAIAFDYVAVTTSAR